MKRERAIRMTIERELGLLTASEEAALERHLGGSPADAEQCRIEREITAGLHSLRCEYPFELGLGREVMERIEEIGAVDRAEVPDRQIAWGTLAAALAIFGLLVGGLNFLPVLSRALEIGPILARAGLSVAIGLAGVALDVLAVQFGLLADAAMNAAAGLAPLLKAAMPTAVSATLAGLMLMTLTITLVVGRDLAGWDSGRGVGGTRV